MKNNVKEKLAAGQKVMGTFFEIGSMTAVECLAIAGLDYFIIDCEHGPFDVERALEFVRAAELKNITPFVRVSDISRPAILKMLDIGAQGLIIPCVDTVEQVRKIVEYGKYPPAGRRGFFFTRVAEYGNSPAAASIDNYLQACNDTTMLIPQCETIGCLENIEEITAIPGVDGIFIGPYDLSIAMEIPGQFTNPAFQQALDRVKKACKAAGKPLFIYAGSTVASNEYFAQGIEGVALGTDLAVYIDGFRNIMKEIKR